MIDFIQNVRKGSESIQFNFTRMTTAHGTKFYVSVGKNRSFLFMMQLKKGQWKIVDAPKVPGWIHEVEAQLSDAIIKQGIRC